jgi:RNA methyltransferase, TrmH family
VSVSQGRTKLIRRLADRKARAREAQILVEGVRCAEEALAAKLELRFGVVGAALERTDRGRTLLGALQATGVELLHATDSELGALANTEQPQGVLLVCGEPGEWEPGDMGAHEGAHEGASAGASAGPYPLLVADGLQDPGNLGTLVRTALAFGFGALIALDGTVDPWNAKCVRASAGALFHIGVRTESWAEVGPWTRERGIRILAGVGDGTDVAAIDPGESWALVIGNEGQGVRSDILEQGAEPISVPMRNGTESLNAAVAGGILMYALAGTPA